MVLALASSGAAVSSVGAPMSVAISRPVSFRSIPSSMTALIGSRRKVSGLTRTKNRRQE